MSHGVIPRRLARGTRGGLAPLARRLRTAGITANAVTLTGAALSVAGGALVALGLPLPALLALVAGSLCDTLDGAIARVDGGGSRLGAFLDSVLDRLSDAAFLGGAIVLGAVVGDPVLAGGGLVALVASFMVSYVRAKAELAGMQATLGLAPREARLVILLIGLGGWAITGGREPLVAAVLTVALLASITSVQRVAQVARALSDSERN